MKYLTFLFFVLCVGCAKAQDSSNHFLTTATTTGTLIMKPSVLERDTVPGWLIICDTSRERVGARIVWAVPGYLIRIVHHLVTMDSNGRSDGYKDFFERVGYLDATKQPLLKTDCVWLSTER